MSPLKPYEVIISQGVDVGVMEFMVSAPDELNTHIGITAFGQVLNE